MEDAVYRADFGAILQLKNISKAYSGIHALDGVSLDVNRGEVHALAGENGAGKSTLIKICSGAVCPDGGKIIIDGKDFSHLTPKTSQEKGIGVIYQEFNLVNQLSVAENIFLGREITKGIIIDKKEMERRAAEIFKQLSIDINPQTLVSSLSVGYQQITEIAKALSMNARLIIMDEPSAPLTNAETSRLFSLVRTLKKAGITIIYISHRLEEIFELSDRVTVMRDGKKIETFETAKTSPRAIIKRMVGRELKETFPSRKKYDGKEAALEVKNLSGNGVKNISFTVKRGEVFGITGLMGAGRTEIAEMIFAIKPKSAGEIKLNGTELSCKIPRDAIDKEIALVPEDRKKHGVLLSFTIRENIAMPILKKLSKLFVINKTKERAAAEKYCLELKIKTPTIEQAVKNLSGGNQQKVVLAKWLATQPKLIILDEPTRGIDVGAKYEIYKLINDIALNGKAVIIISSEMPELIGLCDRIMVIAEGAMMKILEKKEFSQETIMKYASAGSAKKEGDAA
ncbi:MAG: sugar ABC transporter ATP-binding protein [Endomicrobium sp.]|jgi:ribose transport system ATP-binding protein|nr:sugar ABC transporter ATP-binding protein [Endomicrobium sp.]